MATATTDRADVSPWHVVTLRDVDWETFGRPDGDHYEPVERNVALPRLTPALVLDVFDEGETDENA